MNKTAALHTRVISEAIAAAEERIAKMEGHGYRYDDAGAIAYAVYYALCEFEGERGEVYDETSWTEAAQSAIEWITHPNNIASVTYGYITHDSSGAVAEEL